MSLVHDDSASDVGENGISIDIIEEESPRRRALRRRQSTDEDDDDDDDDDDEEVEDGSDESDAQADDDEDGDVELGPDVLYIYKRDPIVWQFYTEVVRQIRERRPYWARGRKAHPVYNLHLADRGRMDWTAFGLMAKRTTAACNYYRGFRRLTDKAKMVQTLRMYAQYRGEDTYAFMPLSFIIKANKPGSERPSPEPSVSVSKSEVSGAQAHSDLKEFLQKQRSMSSTRGDERDGFIRKAKRDPGLIWIAKRSSGGKGAGICISSSYREIIKHIDTKSLYDRTSWVVQQYVEKPFLIMDRKFDMRVWVVLDQDFRVWVYRNAVCRVCTEPYKLEDLGNQYMHLSNHCLQTDHPLYSSLIEGNEMFFDQLDVYLKEQPGGVSLDKHLRPQIHHIIVYTILAAKNRLQRVQPYKSFHFWGYDFMVDADLKVQLLEINATPASAKRLLHDMAEDLLDITVDRMFPPPEGKKPARRNEPNQFELIYDPNDAEYNEERVIGAANAASDAARLVAAGMTED